MLRDVMFYADPTIVLRRLFTNLNKWIEDYIFFQKSVIHLVAKNNHRIPHPVEITRVKTKFYRKRAMSFIRKNLFRI